MGHSWGMGVINADHIPVQGARASFAFKYLHNLIKLYYCDHLPKWISQKTRLELDEISVSFQFPSFYTTPCVNRKFRHLRYAYSKLTTRYNR